MPDSTSVQESFLLEINVVDNYAPDLVEEAMATCANLRSRVPLELLFKDGRASLINKATPNQGGGCVALEDGVMKHRRLLLILTVIFCRILFIRKSQNTRNTVVLCLNWLRARIFWRLIK